LDNFDLEDTWSAHQPWIASQACLIGLTDVTVARSVTVTGAAVATTVVTAFFFADMLVVV
jgi:hypothetical protein